MEDKAVVLDARKTRFQGASWAGPAQGKTIVIGGAGGIGSHLAFSLLRVGYNVAIYDMDDVEEINLAGQLYGDKHIGMPKVDALKDVCDYLGTPGLNPMNMKFTKDDGMVSDITVAGFDNMEARTAMFEQWYQLAEDRDWKNVLFVDGRMSAEYYEVYALDSKAKADYYYKNMLFPDSEASEAPCSYRSTTSTGQSIAGRITATINNFISSTYGVECREVPFETKVLVHTMSVTKRV